MGESRDGAPFFRQTKLGGGSNIYFEIILLGLVMVWSLYPLIDFDKIV